ncbi:MAG: SDR family oxidoreductase [Maritimibacter sp.]
MKVTVIGAGGFVGSRVVKRLCDAPEVTKISLLDRADFEAPTRPNVEKHLGDISDSTLRERVLKEADKVIFLASILGGAAEANYALARRVNVDATLDVFEFLRDQNPKTRLVFASTIAVFAKPLPPLVTDATPTGPSLVYGAQKLMMEVALSNFTTRGWLDGISLRPSGVMARDGADAALKTAFMSRLFWCVKRGEDITLPVAPESRTWLTSVDTVAENFVHGAMVNTLGDTRALTLPALALTFGELVNALQRAFPNSASKITFAPEAEIVELFGSSPDLETKAADELGFSRDKDADELIQKSMV